MKRCFRCLKCLPRSEFYRHPSMADGRLGKCKECARADVRKRYRDKREICRRYEKAREQDPQRKLKKLEYQRVYRSRNKHKDKARRAVSRAIRSGTLIRQNCEICEAPKTEAHHEDYSKPLQVRWLCFRHHREAHGQVVGR